MDQAAGPLPLAAEHGIGHPALVPVLSAASRRLGDAMPP